MLFGLGAGCEPQELTMLYVPPPFPYGNPNPRVIDCRLHKKNAKINKKYENDFIYLFISIYRFNFIYYYKLFNLIILSRSLW